MSTPPATVVARLRAAGCVFAEEEARLLAAAADTAADLAALVARRVAGLPLEHVLGRAEFNGLRVAVGPGVFVPRRRSEFLARRAAALLRPDSVVLDLCCGSGALAVALATAEPRIELHAADIDPAAVRCARHNLGALGGEVYQGDLYRPLPATLRGRVDVLVANVPYVPTGEVRLLPPEAREHEARVALDGGPDGLDLLRRVAAAAPSWLAPGGRLLVETGRRQARPAAAIAARAGLVPAVARSRAPEATVLVATRRTGRHRLAHPPAAAAA